MGGGSTCLLFFDDSERENMPESEACAIELRRSGPIVTSHNTKSAMPSDENRPARRAHRGILHARARAARTGEDARERLVLALALLVALVHEEVDKADGAPELQRARSREHEGTKVQACRAKGAGAGRRARTTVKKTTL